MPHPVRGGGRGGRGRGRSNQGRGGRGNQQGRGRGQQKLQSQEAKLRQAAQQAAWQKQQAQLRLTQLKNHLVLKCFSYLDEQSRKNVFMTMGWPMDNYMNRKEQMRVSFCVSMLCVGICEGVLLVRLFMRVGGHIPCILCVY